MSKKVYKLSCILTACVILILLLRYFYYLVNYLPFGDESETIVTARMMANGYSLYSEIFNHHGPLTFLPALVLELIYPVSVQVHRVWIFLGQCILFFLVLRSPLLTSSISKFSFLSIVVCCFLIWFPKIYGHLYLYQSIAGILIGVAVLNFILPTLNEIQVSKLSLISGVICLASLPFLAFIYIPFTVVCLLCCLNRSNFRLILSTIFITLFLNASFLYAFGSFKGFIAYHFYMNLVVLPKFIGVMSISDLFLGLYGVLCNNAVLLLCCFVLGSNLFLLWPKQSLLRIIVLVIGVGTLLGRPDAFHLLPFYYATIFFAVNIFRRFEFDNTLCFSIFSLMSIYCILKISLLFPVDKMTIKGFTLPTSSEFSNLVKLITDEDDRIIAYSFRNEEYLLSKRLPASGYFFYLPWQKEYNSNPIVGIKIEPLNDILSNKPKVILADEWKVWNKYEWDGYAQEIQDVLRREYVQFENKPYYVRKDLIKVPLLKKTHNSVLMPSQKLSKTSPIQLSNGMYAFEEICEVYILFATYQSEKIMGDIKLALTREDGEYTTVKISSNRIQDNMYLKIDVPAGTYNEMRLFTSSELTSPLSVWEMSSTEVKNSCVIYKYTNGQFGFTPGCPIAPIVYN